MGVPGRELAREELGEGALELAAEETREGCCESEPPLAEDETRDEPERDSPRELGVEPDELIDCANCRHD